MNKIVFDSSIHLGQFCISDEWIRIACKNIQASLSLKPDCEHIGIISYEENSLADDLIWKLPRGVQDRFYPFMDLFHSACNVKRVVLSLQDAQVAIRLARKLKTTFPCAVTCAIAISEGAKEIYTLVPSLLRKRVVEFVGSNYGIKIFKPINGEVEGKFKLRTLEKRYQAALNKFRRDRINLFDLVQHCKI